MFPLHFSYRGMHSLSHYNLIFLQHLLLHLTNLCPFLYVCHFDIKELFQLYFNYISVCLSVSQLQQTGVLYLHVLTYIKLPVIYTCPYLCFTWLFFSILCSTCPLWSTTTVIGIRIWPRTLKMTKTGTVFLHRRKFYHKE